jgi:hypothetical protein
MPSILTRPAPFMLGLFRRPSRPILGQRKSEAHDARVQERITLLHAQRKHLQEKIGWYRSQPPAAAYPDGSVKKTA